MSALAGVTLKIATSLDARIALGNGTSQWITSSESRARVHRMRAEHDAVLVGVGTVLADDPLLTARTVPLPARQPLRIVADSRLRTPPHSRLLQSLQAGRVAIAHADDVEPEKALRDTGASFWTTGGGSKRVSPTELVRRAKGEGIERIFLEGGGTLAASFLREGLVDRVEWFRAPILIGGDGIAALAALGLTELERAQRWTLVCREMIGEDALESWVPYTSSRS